MEVPIIVYELTPRSISVEGDFWEIISTDFEFYKDKLIVNDQDLYSLICEKWNNGELNVKSAPEIQQTLFESFQEPLYLRDKNGNKII